jgi:alpha-L-rhamnosidase
LTRVISSTISPNCSIRSGLIESSWKKAQDKFTLEVKIPANTSAVVNLPAENLEDVKESGRELKSAEGAQVVGSGDGKVMIKVESGRYKFSSILPQD